MPGSLLQKEQALDKVLPGWRAPHGDPNIVDMPSRESRVQAMQDKQSSRPELWKKGESAVMGVISAGAKTTGSLYGLASALTGSRDLAKKAQAANDEAQTIGLAMETLHPGNRTFEASEALAAAVPAVYTKMGGNIALGAGQSVATAPDPETAHDPTRIIKAGLLQALTEKLVPGKGAPAKITAEQLSEFGQPLILETR